ncbi:MAG: hypothetical protein QOF17_488 [Solirubrobacteraceae bacterium]|nr:hypothetical protein [Solirubrobacteraceae bacterium]
MQVAVTGGTGTLGRQVVAVLERRGHAVRALSRSAPRHRVDLRTGAGLAAALDGVEAVVDAANGRPGRDARDVLLGGTGRLLAAEAAAGVGHHVGVSIVGADRVPFGYYEVKTAQEDLVRSGAVPWTIVRSTQFHGLLASVFASTARAHVLPGPGFPLQPVDPREVAVVVADALEAGPSGATIEFAGPERRSVRELAGTWRLATGRRAVVVPLPVPGAAGRALRAGALTSAGARTGRTTFGSWLAP